VYSWITALKLFGISLFVEIIIINQFVENVLEFLCVEDNVHLSNSTQYYIQDIGWCCPRLAVILYHHQEQKFCIA
jgi:hypothetical protein